MVAIDRMGGRSIELFIPFDWDGKRVERISFKPMKLINTELWLKGSYKSIMHLMSDLSGLSEDTLRQLCYPDADRVMTEFINLLPDEVKAYVIKGEVPRKVTIPSAPEDQSYEGYESPVAPEEEQLEDRGGFNLEDR